MGPVAHQTPPQGCLRGSSGSTYPDSDSSPLNLASSQCPRLTLPLVQKRTWESSRNFLLHDPLLHFFLPFVTNRPCQLKKKNYLMNLFLFFDVLGFRCCAQAFCSCGDRGLLSSCGAWTYFASASLLEPRR